MVADVQEAIGIVADVSSDPTTRNEAAQLLLRRYRIPIAPQRWKVIGHSVLDQAAQMSAGHGHGASEEFSDHLLSSIFLATEGINEYLPQDWDRVVQRKLNDLVTKTFLGNGWRRRLKDRSIDDAQVEPPEDGECTEQYRTPFSWNPLALTEVEARVDLERIMSKADISMRAREQIWDAYHGASPGEGSEGDAEANRNRVALHRARLQLKSVVPTEIEELRRAQHENTFWNDVMILLAEGIMGNRAKTNGRADEADTSLR